MLTILLCVVLAVAIIWALAYHAASAALWSGVVGVTLLALSVTGILKYKMTKTLIFSTNILLT